MESYEMLAFKLSLLLGNQGRIVGVTLSVKFRNV